MVQHYMIAVESIFILYEFNALFQDHYVQCHAISRVAYKSNSVTYMRNSTLPCVTQTSHLCNSQAQSLSSIKKIWPTK